MAGELVQGDKTGDETLLDACKLYIKEKYAKPGDVFLGLVHRLDRPVSGAIVFARTSKAASRLSEQFRNRSTKKIYRAVVEGALPDKKARLTHYLTGDKGRLKSSVSLTPKDGAKKAELIYTVLDEKNGRSLVEIELLTGYKHQIRSQLAAVGCPIVGDFKYDRRQKPSVVEQLAQGKAIALHAFELNIDHPTTKERVTFSAPLPDYWPF